MKRLIARTVANLRLRKALLLTVVAVAASVVVAFTALRTHSPTKSRERVQRRHSGVVTDEFRYLTRRYDVDDDLLTSVMISRQGAARDLDELEWLLENRYSYLRHVQVDYRAALDSIRAALDESISRGNLVVQLRKLMCLFGDGHSGVTSSLKRVFRGYLPLHVKSTPGGLVAIGGDGKWLAPEHPYLVAIDGVEVEKWLDAARQSVPAGSQQLVSMMSLIRLRHLAYLRQELSLPGSDTVTVKLGGMDGTSYRSLSMPVAKQFDGLPRERSVISQVIDGILYLRIPVMRGDEEFLASLRRAASGVVDARALIIDVRGNSGGSRALLRELFLLLAPNDQPVLINAARFRNGTKAAPSTRWLYPYADSRFGIAERAAIDAMQHAFKPEWVPPDEQFGPWHYMVLRGHGASAASSEKRIVILMDAANFSATDVFLGAFKGRPGVTLIGEPSSGGSGYAQAYRLQHSQIGIRLSSMASFRPSGQLYDGRGVEPDIFRYPEPTDFNGKSDSVLDYALQVLAEGP